MEKRKHSILSVLLRQCQDIKADGNGLLFFGDALNMFARGLLPVIAIFIPMLIIDQLQNPDIQRIVVYIIAFVILSIILTILGSVATDITEYRAIKTRMHRFLDVNRKFLAMDYKYLEDSAFLDKTLISVRTLDNDNSGYEGVMHVIFNALPLLFSAILCIVIVGAYNPLVLLACVFGVVVALVAAWAGNKANLYKYKRKEEIENAQRHSSYFNQVSYDFSYGKDIRMYNLKSKIQNEYMESNNSYIKILRDIQNKEFLWGLFDVLTLLLQDGLAYFLVIKGYYDGLITLGQVSLYIGAIIALTTTMKGLSQSITDIRDMTRYMGDFYEFIDDASLTSLTGTKKRLDGTLEIEFRNVSFRYPHTDQNVLTNFNLKIAKGEKLAIVGTNGAGKTTLVKLLTGLFTPDSGDILVNGINTKEFTDEEFHKMFAVVFQDFSIYAASVSENVMGNDADGLDKAKKALKDVGLMDKIDSLPKKLEQPLLKIIEDNGIELSGGQNQKLAIARALYKDANMIILDEPTSSLDALAEAGIYRDFDELIKGKTAVYISHRLSSTKFCDHIALLSQYGLIEYGSHDELMQKKGVYYQMFTTQGKYYQEEVANHDEK